MSAPRSSLVESGSVPKWQIALAVGAPVAIGIGFYLYKRSKTDEKHAKRKTGEKSQSEARAGAPSLPENKALQSEVKAQAEHMTPLQQAQTAKNKGNQHFKSGRYGDAIACYTEAIDLCPADRGQDLSTFHQNRAAAHEQLGEHAAALADSERALQHNPRYTKALHRRAKACEQLGRLEQALRDITAVCILEGFQNQSTLLMADRILKQLGTQHAKEAMNKRQPVMPSRHFVQTYMSSFVEDPIFGSLQKDPPPQETPDQVLSGWARARHALYTASYEEVVPACTEEVEGSGPHRLEAALLRGTMHQLTGQLQLALADLTAVIDDNAASSQLRVNALIKRGSTQLQLDNAELSVADFKRAVSEDSQNSDIYHHRGQINLLMEMVEQALDDFKMAVKLKPNFPIALVQKAYTEYRHACSKQDMGVVRRVMGDFEDLVSRFPECSEVYVLYAQVLADQQQFSEADQQFRKAIEVDPGHATVYVHRGLLHLQWKGDVHEATKLISRALELDDKCEFAYETLGTIEVQRGNLGRAVELFDKAIPFAKTESEMSHLFSLRDAARAQADVAEQLGISVPSPAAGL